MAVLISNLNPASGATGVSVLSGIDVDITRVSPPLLLQEIELFSEGQLAFEGSDPIDPFRPPLAGAGSSVAAIADGFRLHMVRTAPSREEFINVQVRLMLDGYVSAPVAGWSFRAGTADTNDFYFADGYRDIDGYLNPEPGIRRLHVRQLVGELKPNDDIHDGYAMPVVLSVSVTPGWPSDIVRSLSSTMVGGDRFLVASTSKGTPITTNETGNLRIYARPDPLFDGYDSYGGHMNANGTLYVINKTLNRVDVYYGANTRPPDRPADFHYDAFSTPSILAGDLLCLHVAEGASTVFTGGSRLYIGCSGGFTRVEAYDAESVPGYGGGLDGHGISHTYGIVGSPTDFPVLGGTVPAVVAINSNEAAGVIFAATNDGTEAGGGLSQVSSSRNSLILFMTHEGGFLPSNVVRDIAD
jgi:hypothetical protein